jgi:hypothetical protein
MAALAGAKARGKRLGTPIGLMKRTGRGPTRAGLTGPFQAKKAEIAAR